ncbi:uncharacterized protein I206_101685 [Kwoniella pini CBS 10737]|uniref:Uncharacterized protein n=1 Tax=Kwoniella pini CBS 10737 TaxID=1296096 RepID=A0AAJ8L1R1_9TREE
MNLLVLTHRLNTLYPPEPTLAINKEKSILDDLYDTVLPKKNTVIRPHQSKAELERRAEKKRKREEMRNAIKQNEKQVLKINRNRKRK